MENKKYEITKICHQEHMELRRIRALVDIYDDDDELLVAAGSLGGFVETEENLSQEGRAWISDNACACGESRVIDDAQMGGHCVRNGARANQGMRLIIRRRENYGQC